MLHVRQQRQPLSAFMPLSPDHLPFADGVLGSGKCAHLGLMLARSATFDHFSVSSAIKLANSAEDMGIGRYPNSPKPALILASASPVVTSRRRASMICPGVLR